MTKDEEYAAEMHARDAAATTAHGMAAVLDAIALMTARLSGMQELLERIAIGLGVDPNAPVSRR